jgi:MoaA/NifB/PqqE/SkfB family radical SAM enzyme
MPQNLPKILKILRIMLPAYFKSRITPFPLWSHLYLTRKCNLNCKYCFVKEKNKKEMSTEQAKKAIDKLHSLGCRFIVLYGGEPCLRKDLVEIISYCKKKGIISYLTTNGTLLTPDLIEQIGKAGIDAVEISIDSIFEFQDSKKDFPKLRKVFLNLLQARKKYGFMFLTVLVLNKKNLDSTIATIKKINSFNVPVSVGMINKNIITGKQSDPSLFFNSEEDKKKLFKVLNEVKLLKKNKGKIIGSSRYFDDLKKFLKKPFNWYCASGKYYIAVDCDGSFMICASLAPEKTSIFNINKNYYKEYEETTKKYLKNCKKHCFSTCYYTTSRYMQNILNPIIESLRY